MPSVEAEWAQGNWSAGREEGGAGGEAGSGYGGGSGSGHGGGEREGSGGMLNAVWDTEGLQTVAIVVLVCASLKLLHLLGVINFSEGKREIWGGKRDRWMGRRDKRERENGGRGMERGGERKMCMKKKFRQSFEKVEKYIYF